MRLSGKLTEMDVNDLRRMVRSKWYWPRFVLENWYGMAIICILLWASIGGLMGKIHPNWRLVGPMWAVVAAFVALAIYRTKRRMTGEFTRLNATLPDWIHLANDGLKFEGPGGASAFQSWGDFKGWREGGRVMLVDRVEGHGFVILPVGDVSEAERQALRDTLRSQLPQ